MTLKEFFELLANEPYIILFYFLLIPFTAFLAGIMGKNEGHLTPWKYLYSVLIYLVCVPGIFAITLNIFLFLFEKQPIMQTDVYTQILPILSMVGTLMIIRNNVSYDQIPGFGKLSGMMMMIFAVLLLMWGLDRTRIYIVAFTRMPFYYVLIIFVGLLAAFRIGMKRVLG
ncbi:MAG: hypothetical protein AB8F74_15095 [Saprospiraceae bacterium]